MMPTDEPAPGRPHDALSRVPMWRGQEPRVVRALGGGPGNDAWLIECAGEHYVLRLDTALTASLPVQRASEAQIAAAVGAAGIGPALEFALPEQGLQVTRFVPGRSWTADDLGCRDNLGRLAQVLVELHAMPPVGETFDLSAAVRHYAARLGAAVTSGPDAQFETASPEQVTEGNDGTVSFASPTAAQAASWANAACALLHDLAPLQSALCHNDLVAANVVDDGTALTLIDWEYAGTGDPFFDLAVVVQHHDLTSLQRVWLLDSYLGGAQAEDLMRLQRYCQVYDYVVLLWLSVVAQYTLLQADQQALWSAAMKRLRYDI